MKIYKQYLTLSSTIRRYSIKIIFLNLSLSETQVHIFSFFIDFLGVGKSCLLARIMDNEFKIEHQVTIGVEFGSFVIKLEDKIVKL